MLSFRPFTPVDMDVRCSRCGTEYEFDDCPDLRTGHDGQVHELRVSIQDFSGRGQGRRAPSAGSSAPPRGVNSVYTSLRELQRGIADKKVGPQDLFVARKASAPGRSLRSQSSSHFFRCSRVGTRPSSNRAQRTLHGVAPPANSIGGTWIKAHPPAVPVAPPMPAPRAPSAPITRTLGSEPATLRQPELEPAPTTARVVTAPGGINPSREQLDALSHNLPADFLRDPHTTLPAGSAGLTPQTPAENSARRDVCGASASRAAGLRRQQARLRDHTARPDTATTRGAARAPGSGLVSA